MVDEKKLARLLELKKQREDAEAEINEILGGEPKRKGRPPKPELQPLPLKATVQS